MESSLISQTRTADEVLSLPITATLTLPNDVPIPFLILKSTANTAQTARIPIHTSSSCTSNAAAANSSPPPKALIIGRQVTTCDIRIDHGSISRKHAALYFISSNTNTSDTSNTSSTKYQLIVQGLGTKHGITINQNRIPSQQSTILYQGDEIIFGKVQEQVFVVGGWISRKDKNEMENENKEYPLQEASRDTKTQDSIENHTFNNNRKHEEDTRHANEQGQQLEQQRLTSIQSRAQREAEIQAMIQSLEQTPSYKKMITTFTSQDDGDDSSRNKEEEDEEEEDDDDNFVTHMQKSININRPNKNYNSTHHAIQQLSSNFMMDPQISSLVSKYKLPISCTISLPRYHKVSSSSSSSDCITALHIDTTGSRLLTGTSHGYLHLYDFSGMTVSQPYPFKSILIEEGQYPIHDVAFSIRSGGDRIFVGTGSPQPTLLDREGKTIIQCTKGDPYVTDTAKNLGHTGSITSVAWHPLGDSSNTTCCNIVLSSSGDSSVRIWDVERNKVIFDKLTSRGEDVLRVKNEKGQRIVMGGGGVTCATFSPNGREIALGTACGSIQIWKYGGPYTRPIRAVYHAHGNKKNIISTLSSSSSSSSSSPAIHSLNYSPNGMFLASRSMDDDTIRLWIASSLTNLCICVGGLVSTNEFTNCAFRPDGNVLCAGTSVVPRSRNESNDRNTQRRESYGRLKFYTIDGPGRVIDEAVSKSSAASLQNVSKNSERLCRDPFLDLPIVEGVSIGKIVWHTKLNQIFMALSDGR